jgi:hypothetical protein
MKRLIRNSAIRSGEPRRNNVLSNIDRKVDEFLGGKTNALANVSLSTLIFWAKKRNWMSGNRYVKHEGKWSHYGGGNVNKKNILNNIKLMSNYK